MPRGGQRRGPGVLPAALCLLLALASAAHAGDAPAASRQPAAGAATHWVIDGARSQAQFRIRLLGIVPMSGEFTELRGGIVFAPGSGEAVVDAWLPSAEVRMANPAHADWARSPEFFDAAAHPTIHFRSRPLPQRVLREGGAIDGELTLRGVTRAVALKVERGGCDPAQVRACEIAVYGQVRRTDFGMAARRATVGDWVSLRLRIVAMAEAAEVE